MSEKPVSQSNIQEPPTKTTTTTAQSVWANVDKTIKHRLVCTSYAQSLLKSVRTNRRQAEIAKHGKTEAADVDQEFAFYYGTGKSNIIGESIEREAVRCLQQTQTGICASSGEGSLART